MMKSASISDAALSRGTVAPRIEEHGAFTVVGLARKQSLADTGAIPGQWRQFMGMYGQVVNKAGSPPLSVITEMDADGNFSYLTGVIVSSAGNVPQGLVAKDVPRQTYVVFTHNEHVSEIATTYSVIWDRWMPESGKVVADGPWLEKNLPSFNPRTGLGGVEIWIPVV